MSRHLDRRVLEVAIVAVVAVIAVAIMAYHCYHLDHPDAFHRQLAPLLFATLVDVLAILFARWIRLGAGVG